jgi:hypothetical protein
VARNLFPIDRTALIMQGPYEPVLTPPTTAIQIFTDANATIPASIQTPQGTNIANSTVFTTNGLIPEFLGPDGAVRLFGKVVGGDDPAVAMFAQIVAAGGGGGGAANFVFTQPTPQSVWTVAHNLGQYPSAVSVFSADLQMQYDEFSIRHTDVNHLLVSMDTPTAGVAVIG